jgi:beta-glucanase (GH16 family)
MRLRLLCLFCALALGAGSAWAQSYELVWEDEFDGSQLDLTRWEPQIGTGCPALCGWGNNELEYYRAENAVVSGGFLTITARAESFGGADYTSARLRTKGLADWTYGRFEMRAKLPIGRGLWPAFWMLPTDETYGGWAASGEIDIMEYVGQKPDQVLGTIHYGGTWPDNQSSSSTYTLPSGDFHDGFHTFALEWEPCTMRWYVDDVLTATRHSWESTGVYYPAPFDQAFHLLLNLAVGGNLPGPPDGSTVFPQEMVVDWVRVYQKGDWSPCSLEFARMDHNDFSENQGWFSFSGGVGGGGISGTTTDLPPLGGGCAALQTGWGSGGTPGYLGGFFRNHPMDLTGATHFTLWIDPDPGQDYTLEINLQDDDNGDDTIPDTPDGSDDEFQYAFHVGPGPTNPDAVSGGGWQRVSIPLASFTDDNSYLYGGNGVFDPYPVSAGGNGRLINVVIAVISNSGADVTFRTDRWAFTRQTGSISGRIWDDSDRDGTPDGGEPGLPGVTVSLFDVRLGQVVATQVTSASGDYAFGSLMGTPYEIRVDPGTLPPGYAATYDPDGTSSLDAAAMDLACDEALAGRDFGYASSSTGILPGTTGGALLLQNVPNPFALRTRIAFRLPEAGAVRLEVYDIAGRRIRTLVDGWLPQGIQEVRWDGNDDSGRPVAGGIYYYALRIPDGSHVRRMVLLR